MRVEDEAQPVVHAVGAALPELHLFGRMRQPPQCGGTGTSSSSANRWVMAASASSSTRRLRTTTDCADAHAPSCEPRGLLAQ